MTAENFLALIILYLVLKVGSEVQEKGLRYHFQETCISSIPINNLIAINKVRNTKKTIIVYDKNHRSNRFESKHE